MTPLGQGLLMVAWATLTASAALWAAGAARDADRVLAWARRLLLVAAAAVVAAIALLAYALLADRFDLAYVARNGQRAMPAAYKVAALWSGQAGSLLLWLWMTTAFAVAVAWRRPPALGRAWPWALAALAGGAAFFALLVAWVEPPFAPAVPPPADGRGMNPLLRHPSMLVHPLLLYAGFTGFAVPFAFAVGALAVGQADAAWFTYTRRWAVAAWLLLTMGILAGAHWAYEVLGWGGYWGWDPVENAALLPWLTATAFLHSAMVQERRGLLRRWNVVLILLTYLLTVLATFLTRSGALVSVHAFAQSDIGPWLLGYLAVVGAACAGLLWERWPQLADEGGVESLLSREAGFLLNNLLLTASAFAVLWGTLFPLLARAFGLQLSVGPPYFERIQGPLFLALLLLMGVGPVLAWRRTAPSALARRLGVPLLAALHAGVTMALLDELRWGAVAGMAAAALALAVSLLELGAGIWPWIARQGPLRGVVRGLLAEPRRHGGYVVHAGVALLAAGVVGSQFFTQEAQLVLELGQRAQVGPYVVQYAGMQREQAAGYEVVSADVRVWADADAHPDFVVRPQRLTFPEHEATLGLVARVAVAGSLARDLYVALGGWDEDGTRVALEVRVKPLVAWIWIGGYVILAGALLGLWPGGPWNAAPAAGGGGGRTVAGAAVALALVAALLPARSAAAATAWVDSELVVLQPRDGFLEVLQVVTVVHPGPGTLAEVRLPLPDGTVAALPRGGFAPGRLAVAGGQLVDRTGLRPGERRTYWYLARLPAAEPPFVLQRPEPYPVRQRTVLLPEGWRVADPRALDLGPRPYGGVRLRGYAWRDLPAGGPWRLGVQPVDPAAGLPVVVQEERLRGWAVPALLALAALLGGAAWSARRPAGAVGGDAM